MIEIGQAPAINVEPVLADLVEIFHPGLLGDHQLVFHRRSNWGGWSAFIQQRLGTAPGTL